MLSTSLFLLSSEGLGAGSSKKGFREYEEMKRTYQALYDGAFNQNHLTTLRSALDKFYQESPSYNEREKPIRAAEV